jgi:hypothetical protein
LPAGAGIALSAVPRIRQYRRSFVKRRRSQSAASTLMIVSGCSRPECKVQVEMAAATVGEWHSYLVP